MERRGQASTGVREMGRKNREREASKWKRDIEGDRHLTRERERGLTRERQRN